MPATVTTPTALLTIEPALVRPAPDDRVPAAVTAAFPTKIEPNAPTSIPLDALTLDATLAAVLPIFNWLPAFVVPTVSVLMERDKLFIKIVVPPERLISAVSAGLIGLPLGVHCAAKFHAPPALLAE